jgi:hypothetical protein
MCCCCGTGTQTHTLFLLDTTRPAAEPVSPGCFAAALVQAPSAEASALRTSFAHFSAAAAARGSDSPEAAAVAGAGGGGQAPAGGVGDESLVAFMDTTSRCLMDQETALAELQVRGVQLGAAWCC